VSRKNPTSLQKQTASSAIGIATGAHTNHEIHKSTNGRREQMITLTQAHQKRFRPLASS
jgi:hypothetical protein